MVSPLPAATRAPTRKSVPLGGLLWRFALRVSPKLHSLDEQRRLADDLGWLGLLLGFAALWSLYANLQVGLGVNALMVTLALLSVLVLGGARAVRSGP